jgi:acetyl-CoA synthetase
VVVTLACVRISALRVSLPLGGRRRFLRDRIRATGGRVLVTADACHVEGRVFAAKATVDRVLESCPEVSAVLVVPQLTRPVPWRPGRDRWWHEALTGSGTLPPRPYPGAMDEASPPLRPADPLRGRLIFDDPLERGAADDTDQGWGDLPPESAATADLARLLHEKPPHHL